MEPRGPAGGGSSGAHRDVEIGGGPLSKRNGSGPGRQTDPGRRPRRQSDRIVRADAVTRRTEVYYADLSSMRTASRSVRSRLRPLAGGFRLRKQRSRRAAPERWSKWGNAK